MSSIDKRGITFRLATKLAWLLILFLGKTARIEIKGQHHWRNTLKSGAGVLIVIWHGKIMLPIYVHRKEGIIAMVSQHLDGEMIAQTIHRLGYNTIRGSSTRGGKDAFNAMLTELKRGKVCAIMPDGPSGPRHKFKAGALYLAQRSGAYILPMTFTATKKTQFNSWDKFTIWWPFAKCIVMYDEPVRIPKNLSTTEMVQYRKIIQDKMILFEKKIDAVFTK